jgi:NADH-quinone oxidoreductase subunit M
VELLLFILPVFFALSVLVMPQNTVRVYGLAGAVTTLAVSLVLLANYAPAEGATIQKFVSQSWLPRIGITLNFGYDAISLIMVVLTTVLVPIILLSNYGRELASNRLFTSMVFLMQLGLIGVFVSLDGIWFYIFWEVTLIPIFLIAYWFGDPERKAALTKFFIYTFFGSLFMLASLIGLKQFGAQSFAIEDLYAVELTSKAACWLLGGFFLAFAVKVPIFPFHTWQPDTYSKSPMAGTMLLSGIMLKMALYGMIRWMLPLFPEALDCVTYPIIVLAVIGVVYGAIIAIKQDDMKRLFAFASLSHVGLIAAGIMTAEKDTLSGSIVQMINHGLVAVGSAHASSASSAVLPSRRRVSHSGSRHSPSLRFPYRSPAVSSVSSSC